MKTDFGFGMAYFRWIHFSSWKKYAQPTAEGRAGYTYFVTFRGMQRRPW